MTSLKTRVKRHIGRVPTVNFFDNWHMARLSLSLAEKIIKFNTHINVVRVENENCEFLQI